MAALTHLKSLHVLILSFPLPSYRHPEIPNVQHNAFRANTIPIMAKQAFDVCSPTLQSVYVILSAATYMLFTLDDSGQVQRQVKQDFSEIVRLFRPWTPPGLSFETIKDYL